MEKQAKNNSNLFQSFQQGDEKAFAHYFEEHYRPLRYYAIRLLKDEALADDIVADTFIKLFLKREIFKSESGIKYFMYAVVKNACIDKMLQQKARIKNHEVLKKIQPLLDKIVLDEMIHTETLSIVLTAIESLTPATRRVVKMFFIEGKDYAEISKELNRSKETIRRQKRQGLEALKQKLFPLSLFIFLLLSLFCFY